MRLIPRLRLHKTPDQGVLTQIEVSLIEEKTQIERKCRTADTFRPHHVKVAGVWYITHLNFRVVLRAM